MQLFYFGFTTLYKLCRCKFR